MAGKTIGRISLKNEFVIEWIIENFFSYRVKDAVYYSPKFSVSDKEWKFEINPNGLTSENSEGNISLFLLNEYRMSPPISICFTFGVKKVDGTVEQLCSPITWMFENLDGYGAVIKRSELLRRRYELVPSNVLTVTCTIWTEKGFEHSAGLDTLSRNFADLFTSKNGSDATLLVQGKEFAVHRWILSARSSVLALTFEVDRKEKRTGIVEISDCDPEAFEQFLKYLYSGKIQNGCRKVMELYKIADKYGVQDLKSYCCMSIMTNLSIENVLESFIFGHQFNEYGIKAVIQKFFNKNFREILGTSKWDEFLSMNTTLANELLKCMAKDNPEV